MLVPPEDGAEPMTRKDWIITGAILLIMAVFAAAWLAGGRPQHSRSTTGRSVRRDP